MTFGYSRVSTDKQDLSRQHDVLQNYGVDKIFSDTMTGRKLDRPELNVLMQAVREGDTVVVESLSRLARSTKGLLEALDYFDTVGVKFVSLKEQIDTKTPTGKLLTTVLSAISQFERDIIVQRTVEGLSSARARGRTGGRPCVSKDKLYKAIRLYKDQEYTAKDAAKLAGISIATLYRAMRAVKEKEGEE